MIFISQLVDFIGGADGTRTRDPRRDRPVSTLAGMSEEERGERERHMDQEFTPFSLAFARTRFYPGIRKSLEEIGIS